MINPPKLIAIEGIDGAGKATQATLLGQRFAVMGQTNSVFSFPAYETRMGGIVGAYLNGRFGDLKTTHPLPISTLYALNRYEMRYQIIDAANKGVAILDRWTGSNLAHQGARIEDDLEFEEFVTTMREIEHGLLGLPKPDVVIFLDVSTANSKDNVATKEARSYTEASHDIHEADAQYLEAVRQRYRQLADMFNWRRVDCAPNGVMRSVEDIGHEVFSKVFSA